MRGPLDLRYEAEERVADLHKRSALTATDRRQVPPRHAGQLGSQYVIQPTILELYECMSER